MSANSFSQQARALAAQDVPMQYFQPRPPVLQEDLDLLLGGEQAARGVMAPRSFETRLRRGPS